MAVHKVEPKIVSQESYKAEANTTAVNYKSINPFSKETQQPAPKKVVSSALFANVDDAYVKNTPKTKTPAPALGGLFNGGKSLTQPTVEVGKVAPLPTDVYENPLKKKERLNFGKLLTSMIPRKTPIGQIPNEADLTTAIEAAYQNPKFREIVDMIEAQGIR